MRDLIMAVRIQILSCCLSFVIFNCKQLHLKSNVLSAVPLSEILHESAVLYSTHDPDQQESLCMSLPYCSVNEVLQEGGRRRICLALGDFPFDPDCSAGICR